MSDERFNRLEELFHRSTAMGEDERTQLLDSLARQDPALHEELLSLLQADRAKTRDDLLRSPLAARATSGLVMPERIGPYRIVRELGHGGMGHVFLAEQDPPLRRQVAIKVMTTTLDAQEMLARFQIERQALARMEHRAIARVLDAGTTPQGLPYFVMEFVRGDPIDAFCRRRRLALAARIGLFEQVCQAVQHAHQRGVVHRDLKSANVLVHEDDNGAPQAKVIDFGVAKASDISGQDATFHTRVGLLLGTPEYMAPEQADPARGGSDTRSDVYSLGVVLYDLLAGCLPFELKRPTSVATLELLHRVREEAPPLPSSRLMHHPDAELLAAERGLDAARLVRQLRSGLDAVVLRCLEKHPDRRYQSPRELVDDLSRWLRHEPVHASTPHLGERAIKFVRRHWLPVAAGVAVLFALAIGSAIAFAQYRQAVRHAEVARRNLADFRRMRDVRRLQELSDQAFWELWPEWPEMALPIEAWLAEVEAIVARGGEIDQRIAAIDQELPALGDGNDAAELHWQRETLALLRGGITQLENDDIEKSALANVRSRRKNVAQLSELMEAHADAWQAALVAIADVTECPLYRGLEIDVPQSGLVPLGRDAQSGLWEFWEPMTGACPERDAAGRLVVGPATAVVFVLLPGGDYFMGAAPSDPRSADPAARANEAPVHAVSVAPYFLAKYEMTQSQWHRTTGQNPARLRVGATTPAGPVQWFHPIEQVSWADASVVLARRGWRLPSESEWEYACRAGTQTPYPYASGLAATHERFAHVRPQPGDLQSALDWTFELLQMEGFFAHRGVGRLEPNAFGLHDMGGNVAEWCEDGYGPYDREPATIDPALSVERVFRGGHFLAAPLHARSAARFHAPLSYSHVTIGVRPARSILHAGERPRAFVAQRNLTIPSHWDLATELRGAATLGSEQR